MEEAFPGDIIGLVNPGEFRLGDTICEGACVNFEPLPQFSPENFAVLRCSDSGRRKQFHRGLEQLLEEGAIQVFSDINATRSEPMLAAVGELQFDVVRFRLQSEYDTETTIEYLPYKLARWIDIDTQGLPEDRLSGLPGTEFQLPYGAKLVRDQVGHQAVLFRSKWDAEYAAQQNPNIRFAAVRMPSARHDSLQDDAARECV